MSLSTFKGFAHDIDNIIHTLEDLTPASYISIKILRELLTGTS